MYRCKSTTMFLCEFGSWLQAHFYVFWGIIGIAAIILVIEGVFIVRSLRKNWQDVRESQQLAEEQENEWKIFRHRMRSLIRQGEEWEVDVSELKDLTQRLALVRKAAKAVNAEKMFLALPFIPLSILIVLAAWIPTLWMLVVLCTVFGLSIIWWIYHGIKWYRYRWAFTVLNQVESKKSEK